MQTNEYFEIGRFTKLCRYAIGKNGNDLLRLGIKLTIIFLILTIFFGMTSSQQIVMNDWFFPILFFSGIFVAKKAFKDLYDKDKCITWMMVPGSSFEKFLSRLLYVLVIHFVLLSFVYMLGVNIGRLFTSMLFNLQFRFFTPFSGYNIAVGYGFYVTATSIFFTGGLYFKKHSIIKTIFFILLVVLVIKIILIVTGIIIFTNGFEYIVQSLPEIIKYWIHSISIYFKLMFFCVIPVFCWLISYTRMKEKEIV